VLPPQASLSHCIGNIGSMAHALSERLHALLSMLVPFVFVLNLINRVQNQIVKKEACGLERR